MINTIYFCLGLFIGILIMKVYIKHKKTKLNASYSEENRVLQLVESSQDIIYYFEVKPEPKFKYLSPAINTLLGKGTMEEAYINPNLPFETIHPDDYEILSKKISGDIDYSKTVIQRWKDDKGAYRWFEEYATPVYDKGELVAVQGIIRNIDEKIKLQKKLEYQITHDVLTGIYNREFFEQIMEKYDKQIDTPIAIILCDLDGLKQLNDNDGHKKGDLLIKKAAHLLNEHFSENAIVSRIGGDEFAIIIINANQFQSESFLARFETKRNQYNRNSKNLKIRISSGFAFSEHSIGKMEWLFIEADKNMYQAKRIKKEKSLMDSV